MVNRGSRRAGAKGLANGVIQKDPLVPVAAILGEFGIHGACILGSQLADRVGKVARPVP
jgi:hypothetical protein